MSSSRLTVILKMLNLRSAFLIANFIEYISRLNVFYIKYYTRRESFWFDNTLDLTVALKHLIKCLTFVISRNKTTMYGSAKRRDVM